MKIGCLFIKQMFKVHLAVKERVRVLIIVCAYVSYLLFVTMRRAVIFFLKNGGAKHQKMFYFDNIAPF